MNPSLRLSFYFFVVVMTGCTSPQAARYVAAPATYVDTAVQGPVAGVGVESQDIDGMVDTMARDLLATPQVVSRSVAPRIVLDDSEFMNKGFQAMDKSMITDSLRVKLNRASQGRMVFLDYAHIGMVQNARDSKRSGATDVGTTGLTQAVAGVDFKLTGAIHQLNGKNLNTGAVQRLTQVTFEMTDMESGALVWSNEYKFQKSGADDVVYQ